MRKSGIEVDYRYDWVKTDLPTVPVSEELSMNQFSSSKAPIVTKPGGVR